MEKAGRVKHLKTCELNRGVSITSVKGSLHSLNGRTDGEVGLLE